MKASRSLKNKAGYITASFATLAFAQSGHTMAQIAIEHGNYSPVVAWITPFLIDGALVQLGLTRLALGSKAPKWLSGVIWAAIALSVALNVWGHGPLGAIAPLMLAVSFESWLRLVEPPSAKATRTRRAKRKGVTK